MIQISQLPRINSCLCLQKIAKKNLVISYIIVTVCLYVVATPIGNFNDITKRALQTLFSVEIVACEDTRKTKALIDHFKENDAVLPPFVSFYEENEKEKTPELIKSLKQGISVALVTNAGTPTISDPGFNLVRECHRQGIKVIPIPGPSSPIAALSASGLPTDKFMFLGFLPKKDIQTKKIFEAVREVVEKLPQTVIFFESPFRIKKTLINLQETFGDINIVVFREMTKIYEECLRGKTSEVLNKITEKGEFVVLFNLKENL